MISRYSRPAMDRIWSDEGKLERWLEVELAALDGWAETGVVPVEAAHEIRSAATVPTPARVAEIEERTHHDVAAFVDAVAGELGPAGRWFRAGPTGSATMRCCCWPTRSRGTRTTQPPACSVG